MIYIDAIFPISYSIRAYNNGNTAMLIEHVTNQLSNK